MRAVTSAGSKSPGESAEHGADHSERRVRLTLLDRCRPVTRAQEISGAVGIEETETGRLEMHRVGQHARDLLDHFAEIEQGRHGLAERADRRAVIEPGAVEGAIDQLLHGASQRIEREREHEDERHLEQGLVHGEAGKEARGNEQHQGVRTDHDHAQQPIDEALPHQPIHVEEVVPHDGVGQ